MSNLSSQQINSSFNGLLQVPGGITTSLQTVQDGNGNPTGLQISSTAIGGATATNFVPSVNNVQVTGATQRSINDGFGDYLSVKDFGAVGNGVTDDTAAFVAALATGRQIFVPKGIYVISSALVMQDGSSLVGEGYQSSILKCNTSAFTGNFLSIAGYCRLENIKFLANGPVAGTAIKAWDSDAGQYSFTGYITIKNVSIYNFDTGLYINNIFFFEFYVGIIQGCNYGTKISPAYDGVGDNGYVTTISFQNVDWIANSVGIYANPTLVSKNISFKKCAIEGSTGASYQSYFSNIGLLHFDDSYFEASSSIPVVKLYSCNTQMNNTYSNGTGGIDLGGDSNTFIANSFSGTSSTDKINANGTSLQNVELNNCVFGSSSVLNSTRLSMYNVSVGATSYKNTILNPALTLTDSLTTNTSSISSIPVYKRTVTATISANSSSNLVTDFYVANIFADDYVLGIAQITNKYNPGLILTVTPATTASTDYFCVVATNTTASPITLTSATLKVGFIKGTAMAI